jgi:uncharacterized repeat protein (TIGR03943 family)
MRRETQNTVLFLLGLSIAMITITGAYTRYVKPTVLPWLAAAAVLLIGLAVTAMIRDLRHRPRGGHHDGHADRSGIVWLLVAPIVLLIFVVPPALSPRAASPTVVAVSTDVLRHAFPALPAERAPTVSLPQVLMRIATDSAGTLDGRLITVTGFTMKEGDHTDLARIVIICCAADAQLARIHLAGPAAPVAGTLPDNTWLSAEGKVPAGQRITAQSRVPTIDVSSVTPIAPPANTYAYSYAN